MPEAAMQRSERQRRPTRILVGLPIAVSLFACFAGCSNKVTRNPLPDWTSSDETDGGGVDGAPPVIAPGMFGITVPASVGYPSRTRVLGTSNQPCAIPLGEARTAGPANAIECVIDMDELDLFAQGLAFDIATPPGGCDYVLYEPYLYASWPQGTGPLTVSYTVQPDGTFSDEVNSQNGVPTCKLDHSKTTVGGPNCCEGSYTLTITSAMTGKSTTKVANWGGISPDCYDGAAFLVADAKLDSAGFPVDTIYTVNREMQQIPIRHTRLSDKYPRITVPLANFVDDGRDGGAAPIALTLGRSRPRYTISCRDHADEVLGQITLNVREWNEKAELAKDGNPNTTGVEPLSGSPIDDYSDWADLADQGILYTRVQRSMAK